MLFATSESEIVLKDDIQALYFYTPWLPFHKKMLVMINKMEDKFKNISFTAVDVDAFSSQCIRFNIDSVPTIVLFKNGKEIKRINGLILTSAFKSALADICTIS